jgi:hypothetical protein
VITIGLLLALAATVGPLPSPAGEPGASLAVRLPGAVRAIVFALLALSAIILLALQRPRRPIEDEALPSRARQRLGAWAAVLGPLPLLVSLAAVWYLLWQHWSGREGHPIEKAFTAIAELLELLRSSRKPPISVPFFDVTIAVLVLLAALAVFALMVLILFADRLEKWWAGRAAALAAPLLPDAFADDGLDDLRAQPDPRGAIIRVYGRFEHALAAARAPRAPWQTPTEFMRATVARLPVPGPPVERLTALFEIARFSERPLGAEARDAACDCLDEIRAALDEEAARAR